LEMPARLIPGLIAKVQNLAGFGMPGERRLRRDIVIDVMGVDNLARRVEDDPEVRAPGLTVRFSTVRSF